jgi:hypothetical protein
MDCLQINIVFHDIIFITTCVIISTLYIKISQCGFRKGGWGAEFGITLPMSEIFDKSRYINRMHFEDGPTPPF